MNDQNKNNRQNNSRQPLDWVVCKDVFDKDSGLVVRISRADGFRPRFSLQIGKLLVDRNNPKGEPRFIRHLGVFARAENGVVAVEKFHTILAQLLEEAHQFIHRTSQQREDEIIETKQSHEKRQLDRDKPKHKPGLKEIAKRDKRAAELRKEWEAQAPGKAKEEIATADASSDAVVEAT